MEKINQRQIDSITNKPECVCVDLSAFFKYMCDQIHYTLANKNKKANNSNSI